ncbi:MAG: hypothetical protein O2923_11840 [Verrucomicrobia bacterium]|nr:hypothetical protein [Verrucomicrobiota bacterium]MDA1087225.1 hypothetical protein [Verrucomicrobiota bacterium]
MPENVRKARLELCAMLAVCVSFILLNLFSGGRYPNVGETEVMYADPAINLCNEGAFVSTAWPLQRRDEFWAGNVPLHAVVLCGWLHLCGVSPLAVRSLSYVLVCISGIVLWRVLLRTRWVPTAVWRLAAVGLFIADCGLTFSYRIGRPDGLTILVAMLLLWAGVSLKDTRRVFAIFILGVIAPAAGIQLVVYIAVIAALLIAFWRATYFRDLLAVFAGVACGIGALWALYSANDVLDAFTASVIGGQSMLGDKGFTQKIANALEEIRVDAGGVVKNPSFLILASVLGVVAVSSWRQGTLRQQPELVVGIVAGISCPAVLFLLGLFPVYYSWMVMLPVSVCLASAFSRRYACLAHSRTRLGLICLLVISACFGLPAATIMSLYEWEGRDYQYAQDFVSKNVTTHDAVLCDYSAYYAVRDCTRNVFLPGYVQQMSSEEKDGVTCIILHPWHRDEYCEKIGGRWSDALDLHVVGHGGWVWGIKGSLPFELYDLRVYRRRPES